MTAVPGPFVAIALVSVLGALLLTRHMRRRSVRPWWGYGHGLLALSSLGWLTAKVWGAGLALAVNMALLLVAFAALGGVFIAAFRLQGERPPLFMIALHALAAVIALGLLLAA